MLSGAPHGWRTNRGDDETRGLDDPRGQQGSSPHRGDERRGEWTDVGRRCGLATRAPVPASENRQVPEVAEIGVCAYNAYVSRLYDVNAPKRPVNMTLNEDLVRCAREFASNLSEQVEKLLAEFVAAERRRRMDEDARLDAAIVGWNDFDEKHGGFADEHVDL